MVLSIVSARFVPALAFAALIFLVGWSTACEGGTLAGIVAAGAVFLVPRMFGHAHLAALDMLTSLAYVAAILAVRAAASHGGGTRRFALAGVVWGLAMLTRFHGVLLVLPIVGWLVWRLRRRAAAAVFAWVGAGVATLWIGWPWLWLDPIAHIRLFAASSAVRQPVNVFYWGQAWPDISVPWHYAPVMFAVTVPLGFLLLGLVGLWAGCRRQTTPSASERTTSRDPSGDLFAVSPATAGFWLIAANFAWLLAVFMGPKTPVYDGVRLFLMAYPLWAVFVGMGVQWIVDLPRWPSVSRRTRIAVVGVAVMLQGIGIVMYHPCCLSHYNVLVGGLGGADRLGFEATYWGDSIGEPILAAAAERAPGQIVGLAPALAPYFGPMLGMASPSMVARQTIVLPWASSWDGQRGRIAILFNRKANLADVPREVRTGRVVAETSIAGVWLARVVEVDHPTTGP
jgi:hypothetical protein